MSKPFCNNEIVVQDFKHLISILIESYFSTRRGDWVFRGVNNCNYALIPKVGRRSIKPDSEKSMFNLFKRQAYPHLTYIPQNNYEWLTLGQHHGLRTRLLDWSFNPLVALYFAVESEKVEDAALYALFAEKRLPDTQIAANSPFVLEKVYKYLPTLVTKRVVVQEGLFTIHADLTTHLGDCLRAKWSLERLIIPFSVKSSIKYALYRLGFHHSSLFQDLDSLAKHIDWHHNVSTENLFSPSSE